MAGNLRDYEISVWTLQDSYIATLKWSGIDHKGQIQQPKMKISDDGTQEFSFEIPMYIWVQDGSVQVKKENPIWYTTREGIIVKNMRKIKVIFNKTFGTQAQKEANGEKVFEFLIVKVEDTHEEDACTCVISCEGLAFHELGHQGYKRELSSEVFIDHTNKYYEGKIWYDSFNYGHKELPVANIDYWMNDMGIRNKFLERVYEDGIYTKIKKRKESTINPTEWLYEVRMNTTEYSPTANGQARDPQVIYEDEYIKTWNNNLMPTSVSEVKEKERMVDAQESNYYNLTQTVAETFGVFCKYEYSYDENYNITGRTIVFYNTFLRDYQGEDFGELTYPNTASSVSREYDSTDITTKMFVRPETDESIYTGQVSIIDSDANPTKEDYLLNFDYLHNIGTISDEQYNEIGKFEKKMRLYNCGNPDKVKAAESRGKGGIVSVDADTNVITIDGLTGSLKRNQSVIVDGVEYLYAEHKWYYLTSLNTCQGIIDLQQQLISKQAEKVTIEAKQAMIEKELKEAVERHNDAQSRITNLGIQHVTKDNPTVKQASLEATKVINAKKSESRYTVELGSNHKGIIEDTIRIYLEYDTTKYEFNDTTTLKGVPESHPLKIDWESKHAVDAINHYVTWKYNDHKETITKEAVKSKFQQWLTEINDGAAAVHDIPGKSSINVTTSYNYDIFDDAVAWIAHACGKASIGLMNETNFRMRVCKQIKFGGKTYKLEMSAFSGPISNSEIQSNGSYIPKGKYIQEREIEGVITKKSWNQLVAARKAWCGAYVDGLKASYITIKNDDSSDINVNVGWASQNEGATIEAAISNEGKVSWKFKKNNKTYTANSLGDLYNQYKSANSDTETYGQFFNQNLGVEWGVNHVISFSVGKDANGNINKITHLVLDRDDVKTVYLLYDFDPSEYYQKIADTWARKIDIKTTEAKDYKNKKAKNDMEIKALETAIRLKIQAKFEEIQRFDHLMGPALRESYWQPENYQNYGDVYSQDINIDFWAAELSRDNDEIKAKFFWDDTLFSDEDKNYYEMGVNRDRHYYPCINLKAFLADYPEHIDNFFANLKNLSFAFYNDGIDKAYKNSNGQYVIKYPVHVNNSTGGWEYQLTALSDQGGTSETMTYTRTVERSEADHVFYMNGAGMQLAFVRDRHGEVIPVLMMTEMDTLPEDVIHFIYQESSWDADSNGIVHPGALPTLGCYVGSIDESVEEMEGSIGDGSVGDLYAVTNSTSATSLTTAEKTAAQGTSLYNTQTIDKSSNGNYHAYGIVKPTHWIGYDPQSVMFSVVMTEEDEEDTMWKEISGEGGMVGSEGDNTIIGAGSFEVSGGTDDDTGLMWGEITGGTGSIETITTKVIEASYTMVYPRVSINSLQLKTAEAQLTIGTSLLTKPQHYYLFVRGNDYLLTIKPAVLYSNIASKNKVINIVKDYFFGKSSSSVGVTEQITKVKETRKEKTVVLRKNSNGTYTGSYNKNKVIGETLEAVEIQMQTLVQQDDNAFIDKSKYVTTSGPFTLTYTIGNGGTYVYVDAIRVLKENSVPKVSYTFQPNLVKEVLNETYNYDEEDEGQITGGITGGSGEIQEGSHTTDDGLEIIDNRVPLISQLYNNIGRVMMINDYELKFNNVFGYISSVDLDLDQPWEDDIEVKNYKNKFEDLFSSITAEAEEMKKNGGILASFNAGNLLPIMDMSLSDLIEDLILNSSRLAALWDERFDTRETVVNELSKAIREANEILDYGVDSVYELQDLNDENAMLLFNMAQNIKAMVTPKVYHGDPTKITGLKPGDVIIGDDNKRYLAADYGNSDSASIFPYFDGTVSHLIGANVDWNAETGEVSIMGSTQIDIKGGADINIAANDDIYIIGNNSVNIGGATINIGSVWDDTLQDENGNTYGGYVPGGINIISSAIGSKDNISSWVKIHPYEISMASSNIIMKGSERILMVASKAISGNSIATSGIQIDHEKGIYIGTNGGGVEIYSGANSLSYDADEDYVSGGVNNGGSSVSIRPGRILMGVVSNGDNSGAISYNNTATSPGTALKITKDFLAIGSSSDVSGLTAVSNAPNYTGAVTGAYIGATKIAFATTSGGNRDLISLGSSDGIIFAHAQINSNTQKYYVRNTNGTTSATSNTMLADNIVGSYVQINSNGIKLGSTANIYINTDNLKLQTMAQDGTAGTTIFALGSGLQNITSLAQATANNSGVQLFSNGSDFMVRGAIYATSLYIGETNYTDLNSAISTIASQYAGFSGSYLGINNNGIVAAYNSGGDFTGLSITRTGLTIASTGSFVVNTGGAFQVNADNLIINAKATGSSPIFKVANSSGTQSLIFDGNGNLNISGTVLCNSGSQFTGSGSSILLQKEVSGITHVIEITAGGNSNGRIFDVYTIRSDAPISQSTGPRASSESVETATVQYSYMENHLYMTNNGLFVSEIGRIGGWDYNEDGFYKSETYGGKTMEVGFYPSSKNLMAAQGTNRYSLLDSDVNSVLFVGPRPSGYGNTYRFNLTTGGYLRGGIYITSAASGHTANTGDVRLYLNISGKTYNLYATFNDIESRSSGQKLIATWTAPS